MRTVFTYIHRGLTTFIMLGVLVQLFLAGIWHAHVVSSPEAHIMFGLTLLLASLLAFIAALLGRLERRVIAVTALLFLLILLQPILIEQRWAGIPLLSAFHTLNATFIAMTSGIVARLSRAAVVRREETATPIVSMGD